jgi:anaerobic ribonucleoside-triphosphate reductase activating protein
MILQLNKIQYPIYNLGPGKRFGIWVQGCSIHCKGCINKSTWAKKQGRKMHILDIYNLIELICKDYDGITITGGEPFDQYPELMTFAYLVKKRTKLNILCYTGYYLHELEQKYPDKAFYNCIDLLIDGRYEKERSSSNSLKGSDNQAIYKFVDKKDVKTNMVSTKKRWSVNAEEDTIYMAGIPADNEMLSLTDNLKTVGIHLKLV